MRYPTKLSLMTILLLLLPPGLQAGTGIQQMDDFLKDLKGLKAGFEQSVMDQNKQIHRLRGMFYIKRPDRFRWDYMEPERQQIIADGRQIWLYDIDLEQVSVQSQKKALNGTPAMLLMGDEPVENSFEVRDIGDWQGLGWVELIPRDEESQFERIRLAFRDNELSRMEMDDKFGQRTQFQFYDLRQNPAFKNDFFRFTPPEDIDRYNQ